MRLKATGILSRFPEPAAILRPSQGLTPPDTRGPSRRLSLVSRASDLAVYPLQNPGSRIAIARYILWEIAILMRNAGAVAAYDCCDLPRCLDDLRPTPSPTRRSPLLSHTRIATRSVNTAAFPSSSSRSTRQSPSLDIACTTSPRIAPPKAGELQRDFEFLVHIQAICVAPIQSLPLREGPRHHGAARRRT